MHAALGQPGGAAGVRQQSQVVGSHGVCWRRNLAGHSVGPYVHMAPRQFWPDVAREQPVTPSRRRRIVTCARVKRVGEMGDDQVCEPLLGG